MSIYSIGKTSNETVQKNTFNAPKTEFKSVKL